MERKKKGAREHILGMIAGLEARARGRRTSKGGQAIALALHCMEAWGLCWPRTERFVRVQGNPSFLLTSIQAN